MEFIRWDTLRNYGLAPEDLTITFDYIYPDSDFTSCMGRKVHREKDGFYHCSKGKWQGIANMQGMRLIEEREE